MGRGREEREEAVNRQAQWRAFSVICGCDTHGKRAVHLIFRLCSAYAGLNGPGRPLLFLLSLGLTLIVFLSFPFLLAAFLGLTS